MIFLMKRNQDALSRIDALTAFVLIAGLGTVLSLLLLPQLPRNNKGFVKRIRCIANLKEVGSITQNFVNDHQARFPWHVPREDRLESKAHPEVDDYLSPFISNDLRAALLYCPADKERRPAKVLASLTRSNISYFICLDADENKPNDVITGDRNITGGSFSNWVYVLPAHSNQAEWQANIHIRSGNIGLADGSAQQVTAHGMNQKLQQMTPEWIRMLIP
jgi:hypothetical protein